MIVAIKADTWSLSIAAMPMESMIHIQMGRRGALAAVSVVNDRYHIIEAIDGDLFDGNYQGDAWDIQTGEVVRLCQES